MSLIRLSIAIFLGYLMLPLIDISIMSKEFLYLVLGILAILQLDYFCKILFPKKRKPSHIRNNTLGNRWPE